MRREINASDGDLLAEVGDFLKQEATRDEFDTRDREEIARAIHRCEIFLKQIKMAEDQQSNNFLRQRHAAAKSKIEELRSALERQRGSLKPIEDVIRERKDSENNLKRIGRQSLRHPNINLPIDISSPKTIDSRDKEWQKLITGMPSPALKHGNTMEFMSNGSKISPKRMNTIGIVPQSAKHQNEIQQSQLIQIASHRLSPEKDHHKTRPPLIHIKDSPMNQASTKQIPSERLQRNKTRIGDETGKSQNDQFKLKMSSVRETPFEDDDLRAIEGERSPTVLKKKYVNLHGKLKSSVATLDSTLNHAKLLSSSLATARDEVKILTESNKLLQARVEELTTNNTQTRTEKAEWRRTQSKLESKISALESDLKALTERESEWSKVLQEERQRSEAASAALEELMLREEEWVAKLAENEKRIDEKEKLFMLFIKDQEGLAADLVAAEAKEANQNKEIEGLRHRVEELEAYQENAEQELSEMKEQNQLMIEDFQKQTKADEDCLEQIREELADAEQLRINEIASLQEQLEIERSNSTQVKDYAEKIMSSIRDIETAYERLMAENEVLASKAEEVSKLTDDLAEMKREKIVLEEENGEYQKALEVAQIDLEQTLEEIERLKEDRNKLRAQTDMVCLIDRRRWKKQINMRTRICFLVIKLKTLKGES